MTNALLRWYESRRTRYAWRRRTTPYRVLVSEVMLQQTQAARVEPAFRRFVRRFPSVRALAAAPRAEVVRAWSGLGYNRRAVALSEAARAIVREHGGRIPSDVEALRRLPGIGPYTAAAIASFAFGAAEPAIDTNVGRVVSRVHFGREADDTASAEIRGAAERWIDRTDPASWNQAVMDLGRDVCRPVPRCDSCPISTRCHFRRAGRVGVPLRRKTEPFEGSSRQLRGRIVVALRDRNQLSLATLVDVTGSPIEQVRTALDALSRDGIIAMGDPSGRRVSLRV